MRLAAGLLSDQKCRKYRSKIKSIESIAVRSKVLKAGDYKVNPFLGEEGATVAVTGVLKMFSHINWQSLVKTERKKIIFNNKVPTFLVYIYENIVQVCVAKKTLQSWSSLILNSTSFSRKRNAGSLTNDNTMKQ